MSETMKVTGGGDGAAGSGAGGATGEREFRPLPKSDAGYGFNESVAVRIWHDGRFIAPQTVRAVRYLKADGSLAFALNRLHGPPAPGSEVTDSEGFVYVVTTIAGRAPFHHCGATRKP